LLGIQNPRIAQMYEINDTIVAVSSPPGAAFKSIIRISGPKAIRILEGIFADGSVKRQRGIYGVKLRIDGQFEVAAEVYLYFAPHSYNGDDLAEIHICTSPGVVERIIAVCLGNGARPACPGEFTARAYLNGRIDLTQAEAVAEVVASSNRFQLAAAEKLLAGRLAENVARVREELLDIISLIEVGMDFSGEEIEFITCQQAIETINRIRGKLEALLAGSIRYEALIDMAAVGIGGAANAGKSSLLNALLGEQRSIVSSQKATTRDVLTGLLSLTNCDCVVFDCAGLTSEPGNTLDELSKTAAIEALNTAALVIFCVDVSMDDYAEQMWVLKLLTPNRLVVAATKCDLVGRKESAQRIAKLSQQAETDYEFIVTSSKTGEGIELLKSLVDEKITELKIPSSESGGQITLTERHRRAVNEAIINLLEAVNQLGLNNDEIASMLLRAGCRALSSVETEDIDDAILERIFSRFCIGK